MPTSKRLSSVPTWRAAGNCFAGCGFRTNLSIRGVSHRASQPFGRAATTRRASPTRSVDRARCASSTQATAMSPIGCSVTCEFAPRRGGGSASGSRCAVRGASRACPVPVTLDSPVSSDLSVLSQCARRRWVESGLKGTWRGPASRPVAARFGKSGPGPPRGRGWGRGGAGPEVTTEFQQQLSVRHRRCGPVRKNMAKNPERTPNA